MLACGGCRRTLGGAVWHAAWGLSLHRQAAGQRGRSPARWHNAARPARRLPCRRLAARPHWLPGPAPHARLPPAAAGGAPRRRCIAHASARSPCLRSGEPGACGLLFKWRLCVGRHPPSEDRRGDGGAAAPQHHSLLPMRRSRARLEPGCAAALQLPLPRRCLFGWEHAARCGLGRLCRLAACGRLPPMLRPAGGCNLSRRVSHSARTRARAHTHTSILAHSLCLPAPPQSSAL